MSDPDNRQTDMGENKTSLAELTKSSTVWSLICRSFISSRPVRPQPGGSCFYWTPCIGAAAEAAAAAATTSFGVRYLVVAFANRSVAGETTASTIISGQYCALMRRDGRRLQTPPIDERYLKQCAAAAAAAATGRRRRSFEHGRYDVVATGQRTADAHATR